MSLIKSLLLDLKILVRDFQCVEVNIKYRTIASYSNLKVCVKKIIRKYLEAILIRVNYHEVIPFDLESY